MSAPHHAVLLSGGTVVTVDGEDRVFEKGDVLIDGGRITAVGPSGSFPITPGTRVVDVGGDIVGPGFVQAHVHLCQVLFRGVAEDRALMPWLQERIWPLEAAHSADTLRASARLGIAELLLGGTTTVLDMGTVHHTEVLFEEAARMGLRYFGGKAMMDRENAAGLNESTAASLSSSNALADRFHNTEGGRLRYAYAPRFILSCTDELMRTMAKDARARGCLIHTHASENPGEIEAVRAATGTDNVNALAALDIAGPDVVLAHCVHVSDDEVACLVQYQTRVVHCPSANLKLASGIAPIPRLLEAGIVVGLGADGAPCNNRLSAFTEMRSASLLQKPSGGAQAMPARRTLRLATIDAARALGIGDDTGSLEVGKKADIMVVGRERPHLHPRVDATATLVFAAEAGDVTHVFVDGRQIVRDRRLVATDLGQILNDADAALDDIRARTGIQ
jgi:cytosine/adenosine deaminase-related metal-dependent hydrolase